MTGSSATSTLGDLADRGDARIDDGAVGQRRRAAPPSSGSAAMSSAEVSRVPPCTMRVLSPSVIVPSGSSTPLASRASRIDWLLKPPAASSSVSGVISMRLRGGAEQRHVAHVVDLLQVADRRRLEARRQLVLVEVAGDRDHEHRQVGERAGDHARVDRLGQRRRCG